MTVAGGVSDAYTAASTTMSVTQSSWTDLHWYRNGCACPYTLCSVEIFGMLPLLGREGGIVTIPLCTANCFAEDLGVQM